MNPNPSEKCRANLTSPASRKKIIAKMYSNDKPLKGSKTGERYINYISRSDTYTFEIVRHGIRFYKHFDNLDAAKKFKKEFMAELIANDNHIPLKYLRQ